MSSSTSRGRSPAHVRQRSEDESFLSSRQLEVFGRTLHATASHLVGGNDAATSYRSALGEIHRELKKPMVQRSVFALAKANPRELVRSRFSSSEIQQRALAHVPDELLRNIPTRESPYSLFQGFEATRPEDEQPKRDKHGRRSSKGQHLLPSPGSHHGSQNLQSLHHSQNRLKHRLDMMAIRKGMCSSEIREIDKKLANLQLMRRQVVDRLAALEQEEIDLEHELSETTSQVLQAQDDPVDLERPPLESSDGNIDTPTDSQIGSPSFMSESIYQKLPSPNKPKKRRMPRRKSMPILHEHLEPGTCIRNFQAHDDMITAIDFDVPFGTLVTAALDDTLRVWDLNTGHCTGMLEGHLSSVRCLQVQDDIVASGSNDATVRLWDLSQADYTPHHSSSINKSSHADSDDQQASPDLFPDSAPGSTLAPSSMADCPLHTLSAHVAEVTAIHFDGNTLVSGSSDKTLRQWDVETGRCVQTLDVLWAAAQASATTPSFASDSQPVIADTSGNWYRPAAGRISASEADFVGALQTFQSAVACGTADSVIRLWDLRSGMVQRSLIGHTGPITALQFDDVHLVTGSMDRSIRVRTPSCLEINTNVCRSGTFGQDRYTTLLHMTIPSQQ